MNFQVRTSFLASVIIAVAAMAAPISGYAATAAEQELITQLQMQIQTLQAKLNALLPASQALPSAQTFTKVIEQPRSLSAQSVHEIAKPISPPPISSDEEGGSPPSFNFSRDLFFGLRNDADITNLQEFLTDQGFYNNTISGNFFILTRNAVKKFQSANGISPTGYFGSKSRAIANRFISKELGIDHICITPVSCAMPPTGCAYQDSTACSCGTIVCKEKEIENALGHLSIEPSPMTVKTGETAALRTYYQPPMPPCPAGLACIQMMPARVAVDAVYTSDNPAVAAVEGTDAERRVRGVSAGTAVITAVHHNFTSAFIAKIQVTVLSETY